MAGFSNGGSGVTFANAQPFYATNYATSGTIGIGNVVADTAAMTGAANAAKAAGAGIVVFPAGTFKISSFPTFSPSGAGYLPYAVQGAGAGATIFQSYATSLATSLTASGVYYIVQGSPVWGGFTIDGTNATGTAVGLAWGDVSQFTWSNMAINNFTGASGGAFYVFNNVAWTERGTLIDVSVNNNTYAFDFNVTTTGYPSFDYWSVLSLNVTTNANQNVIVDEISQGTLGGAAAGQIQHIGCYWRMVINANNAATNTGTLFVLKGFSKWTEVLFDVTAEVDGAGATNHKSFNIANASTAINSTGVFILSGAFVSPTLNYSTQLSGLNGYVSVPGYGSATAGLSVNNTGIARQVTTAPTSPTLTSGTQYQNTSGYDQIWTIPINSTGAMTAKLTKQFYSITIAPTTLVAAAALTGATIPVTVIVQNNNYIRIDLVNGTFGTITAEAV